MSTINDKRPPALTIIGKGKTAEVYATNNSETHSPWAVKIFKPEYSSEQQYEITMMDHVKNAPHTVQLRAKAIFNEQVGFAMSRYKGGELFDVLQKTPGNINAKVMFHIAGQTMEALEYYKSKGVVHGDLKMENMGYDLATRELKIADFGYAFFAGENSRGGTIYVMTQELLMNPKSRVSFEEDMWAYGVIHFTALTGYNLFLDSGNMDVQELNKYDFLKITDDIIEKKRLLAACSIAQQLGGPFLDYYADALHQKYSISEDKAKQLADEHVKELSKKQHRWFNIPWQERIRTATAQKGGSPQEAQNTITFLEKIFTTPAQRLNPTDALKLLASFQSAPPQVTVSAASSTPTPALPAIGNQPIMTKGQFTRLLQSAVAETVPNKYQDSKYTDFLSYLEKEIVRQIDSSSLLNFAETIDFLDKLKPMISNKIMQLIPDEEGNRVLNQIIKVMKGKVWEEILQQAATNLFAQPDSA